MDRSRDANFSEPEWRWLHDGMAADRVVLNPRRFNTYRRSGSLLAAHVHNYLHARVALRAQPPSHLLFLASNCFFFRPGIEAFVASRESSAALRACPEFPIRANKHHCTTQPWFAAFNGHKVTHRRLLIEGQFYPVAVLEELSKQLTVRDGNGKIIRADATRGGASGKADGRRLKEEQKPTPPPQSVPTHPPPQPPQSLLHALLTTACTVEESLLPAFVLRAERSLFGSRGGQPATEPVAWIPKSLSNGSTVDAPTVRWLLGSAHTPQSLCKSAFAGAGACSVCPDPHLWPQTKFLVKRVSEDNMDRTGVRRLIAGLGGVSRSSSQHQVQGGSAVTARHALL